MPSQCWYSPTGINGAYNYTFQESYTYAQFQEGDWHESSHEAGSYAGGAYNLSSAVYDRGAWHSYTLAEDASSDRSGSGTGYSYAELDSHTYDEAGESQFNEHQAGTYVAGDYALASYLYGEAETLDWEYHEIGERHYTSSGTDYSSTYDETWTYDANGDYDRGLHEEGSYSGGALSLSCFVLDIHDNGNSGYYGSGYGYASGWGANGGYGWWSAGGWGYYGDGNREYHATGSDSYSSPDYSSANSWTLDEAYHDSFDLHQAGTFAGEAMSLSSHTLASHSDGDYDSHRQGWSSSPEHYLVYTDDADWTYLTTQNEQGSYSGGAYAFATFAYLNTSQSNSHYHEEGWDSTYSSYVSDNASHYYSIYTVAGAGTTGTYTDHSDGWSSDYFYGARWDGGVDSDSSYDSYVYDDTGETGIDSAAYPPAPIFNLPSPRASVRAYLAAVDSYFAGYHGPHAVGRGPNALGHTRNIHGSREADFQAALIDRLFSGAPSLTAGSQPQAAGITQLADHGQAGGAPSAPQSAPQADAAAPAPGSKADAGETKEPAAPAVAAKEKPWYEFQAFGMDWTLNPFDSAGVSGTLDAYAEAADRVTGQAAQLAFTGDTVDWELASGTAVAGAFLDDVSASFSDGRAWDSFQGWALEWGDQLAGLGIVTANTVTELAYNSLRVFYSPFITLPPGNPWKLEQNNRLVDMFGPLYGNVEAFENGRVVGAHTFHAQLTVVEVAGTIAGVLAVGGWVAAVGIGAGGAGIAGIGGGAITVPAAGSGVLVGAIAGGWVLGSVAGGVVLTDWGPLWDYHFNYMQQMQPSAAAQESAPRGSANPATKAASGRGSTLHSDKPGHLPDQLRQRYPETQFEFSKPGVPGQDVRVIGGKHPSEYPGSTWPKGVDRADFKPATPGGNKTFKSDQRKKWPEPTEMLPYDPNTGTLQ